MSNATLVICLLFFGVEIRKFAQSLRCARSMRAPMSEDAEGRAPPDEPSVIARPLMFTFLWTWALPLSFAPLYARSLPVAVVELSPKLIMALPISIEMLCALCTATWAGSLADRRDWRLPVGLGLGLSVAGAGMAAVAPVFEWFAAARAVTGLGYGLAWMGIQGGVVRASRPGTLTFNVANLTAGIFTGHLLGTVTGGLLADAFGYRMVFVAGALGALVPAAYLAIVWTGRRRTRIATAPSGPVAGGGGLGRLLADRNFAALLLGSVIPFSIAQVGLLYYAVPVVLDARGLTPGDIGQVIAIYSATMVFVAPILARRIDEVDNKKLFVAAGGLIGSASLFVLLFAQDTPVVVLSTALLGFASSIGGAAQSSYALQFRAIRQSGIALSTGLQRAADKLGQMLGPLVVSSLFSLTGLPTAVALTGVLYMLATLSFIAFAEQPGVGSGKPP